MLSNVRNFIILLSREALTPFSINNRTKFLVTKKKKEKVYEALRGVSSFDNTRKNFKCNVVPVLVLVLKSKAL